MPEPVAVERVELRWVRLPLRRPWVTAHGSMPERTTLLVHALGPHTEGWGECVALDGPWYSPEYVAGASDVLRNHLLPLLAERRSWRGEDVAPALSPVKGHPMAKAALEMAVLDAELGAAGTSLARHLGARRATVPAGVSVDLVRPLPALLDQVAAFVDLGYRRVKLKVEPGWDVEPVRAVRERFGDDLLLQVDANGAYRHGEDHRLDALDPFGLLLIEQPLGDEDLAGHARLARRIATPVCLDESITSAHAAETAIALGACSVVNVKAGRVGGYLEAVRVHDVCVAHGVAAWCGGMLETGLGRAANVALAALPGFTLPGDLSGSDRFFHTDITPPAVVIGGELVVPTGPGLGVEPLPEALEELTVASEWFELR